MPQSLLTSLIIVALIGLAWWLGLVQPPTW